MDKRSRHVRSGFGSTAAALLVALVALVGCTDGPPPVESASGSQTPSVADTAPDQPPRELEVIPPAYFSAADQQGTLAELTYDTYESMSYEQRTQTLTKRAIVYLPHGYQADRRYNVFYLMRGGWGNETTTLGTPGSPSGLKNVLDHGIAAGEIEPLIVVAPTYNNTSAEDSANFGLALTLHPGPPP